MHIDYWSGNLLWEQGYITAVVDWEEAAYGDPAIDVAYSRMDMIVSGLGHVAEIFLQNYEAEMGRRVANLGLWELAAAARPMFNQPWRFATSPGREHFRAFIADAKQRASLG
ncbi:phosphotransferase [Candidatus Gracilibacteria bacterium]|nr:phosphotransferase [Candidatus Gracilibacteria bacterium]